MKIVRTVAELASLNVQDAGFVPTMGALHEGHLSLMRTAKAECGQCVISIFVNPTQFGPGEDYTKYPRQEENDLLLAERAGADVAFCPSTQTMYPDESTTKINVGPLSTIWEGALRPGHFDGVATVVAKLFHRVGAATAYFGQKDYQQCLVIRRMVEDLAIPVKLRFCDTVRDIDGLALSSRNAYLSPAERSVAPRLFAALVGARAEILAGRAVDESLAGARQHLGDVGFSVQYFAYVNAETLEASSKSLPNARLIGAARLGTTRLIDNIEAG